MKPLRAFFASLVCISVSALFCSAWAQAASTEVNPDGTWKIERPRAILDPIDGAVPSPGAGSRFPPVFEINGGHTQASRKSTTYSFFPRRSSASPAARASTGDRKGRGNVMARYFQESATASNVRPTKGGSLYSPFHARPALDFSVSATNRGGSFPHAVPECTHVHVARCHRHPVARLPNRRGRGGPHGIEGSIAIREGWSWTPPRSASRSGAARPHFAGTTAEYAKAELCGHRPPPARQPVRHRGERHFRRFEMRRCGTTRDLINWKAQHGRAWLSAPPRCQEAGRRGPGRAQVRAD